MAPSILSRRETLVATIRPSSPIGTPVGLNDCRRTAMPRADEDGTWPYGFRVRLSGVGDQNRPESALIRCPWVTKTPS